MRKRISRNIRVGRLLIIPLLIVLVFFNIYIFFFLGEKLDNFTFIFVPGLTIIFIIVGYFLYKYFDNFQTIEYDENKMYVSDKFGVKEILLDKIISLTMTTTILNGTFKWKIIYIDKDREEYASFFPRPLNINLADFSKTIKTKNPDAKLQDFSFGPFQFDKTSD